MGCRERIEAWGGRSPKHANVPSSVSLADRPAWFIHALNPYDHFQKAECVLCRAGDACWRGDSELTRLLEIEGRR